MPLIRGIWYDPATGQPGPPELAPESAQMQAADFSEMGDFANQIEQQVAPRASAQLAAANMAPVANLPSQIAAQVAPQGMTPEERSRFVPTPQGALGKASDVMRNAPAGAAPALASTATHQEVAVNPTVGPSTSSGASDNAGQVGEPGAEPTSSDPVDASVEENMSRMAQYTSDMTGGLPEKLTDIQKASGAAVDAQQALVGEENELKAQLAIKEAEKQKALEENERAAAEGKQNLWNKLTSDVEDDERRLKEFDHDPQRVFKNMSVGGKIATALALFMGGYNQDKTGGRNLAMEAFNNMVQNDMASQREEFQALRDKVQNGKASRGEKMAALEDLNQQEARAEAAKWSAITGQIKGAIEITQNAQKIPELELLQQATDEKRAEVLANYTQRVFGAIEQVRSNMAQEANARYAIEQRALLAAAKAKKGGTGSGAPRGGEYDPNKAVDDEQRRRAAAKLPLLTKDQLKRFVGVPLVDGQGKPLSGIVLSGAAYTGEQIKDLQDEVFNATNLVRQGADLARRLQAKEGIFRLDDRGYPIGMTEEGAKLASDYANVQGEMIKYKAMGASFTPEEAAMLRGAIGGDPTQLKALMAKTQGGQIMNTMRKIAEKTTGRVNFLAGRKDLKIIPDADLKDAAPPAPPPKLGETVKAAAKGDPDAINEIATRYRDGSGFGAIRDAKAYKNAVESRESLRGGPQEIAGTAISNSLLAYEDKVKDAALKSLVKGGEAAKLIGELQKHKGLTNPERVKIIEKLAAIAGAVKLKAPKRKEEEESLPAGAPEFFDPNSLNAR